MIIVQLLYRTLMGLTVWLVLRVVILITLLGNVLLVPMGLCIIRIQRNANVLVGLSGMELNV